MSETNIKPPPARIIKLGREPRSPADVFKDPPRFSRQDSEQQSQAEPLEIIRKRQG